MKKLLYWTLSILMIFIAFIFGCEVKNVVEPEQKPIEIEEYLTQDNNPNLIIHNSTSYLLVLYVNTQLYRAIPANTDDWNITIEQSLLSGLTNLEIYKYEQINTALDNPPTTDIFRKWELSFSDEHVPYNWPIYSNPDARYGSVTFSYTNDDERAFVEIYTGSQNGSKIGVVGSNTSIIANLCYGQYSLHYRYLISDNLSDEGFQEYGWLESETINGVDSSIFIVLNSYFPDIVKQIPAYINGQMDEFGILSVKNKFYQPVTIYVNGEIITNIAAVDDANYYNSIVPTNEVVNFFIPISLNSYYLEARDNTSNSVISSISTQIIPPPNNDLLWVVESNSYPHLELSPTEIELDNNEESASFEIINTGNGTLQWEIENSTSLQISPQITNGINSKVFTINSENSINAYGLNNYEIFVHSIDENETNTLSVDYFKYFDDVTYILTTSEFRDISISWRNPENTSNVKIVYNSTNYPESIDDGECLFDRDYPTYQENDNFQHRTDSTGHHYFTIFSMFIDGQNEIYSQGKDIAFFLENPIASALSCTNITETSVSLSWAKFEGTIFQEYQLSRQINSEVYETIATLDNQNTTSFIDTNLSYGTPYSYILSTVTDYAISLESNLQVTTLTPSVNLTFTNVTESTASLVWTRFQGSSFIKYVLSRSNNDDPYIEVATIENQTTTVFTDTNLNYGTTYRYILTLYTEAGPPMDSNVLQVYTDTPPAEWRVMNVFNNEELTSIDASDSRVIIVGDDISYVYQNNIWTQLDLPLSTIWPDVVLITDNLAYASTYNGMVEYNGNYWYQMYPEPDNALIGLSALENNTMWGICNPTSNSHIWYFNGFSWVEQASYFDLSEIDAISENDVFCCSRYGLLYHYNGSYWDELYDLDSSFNITGLKAYYTDDIWIVGGFWSDGDIVHFINSSVISYEVEEYAYCIDGVDSNNLWIGAANGIMYHWDGSGFDEILVDPGHRDIYDIKIVNPTLGYAIAEGGVILKFSIE